MNPRFSPLLVAERPAPPRELLVPQAEVTARSLRLQWVPGSDGASPIRYFTVQVRELPGGEWQTYSSSVSHEATACAVERYCWVGVAFSFYLSEPEILVACLPTVTKSLLETA